MELQNQPTYGSNILVQGMPNCWRCWLSRNNSSGLMMTIIAAIFTASKKRFLINHMSRKGLSHYLYFQVSCSATPSFPKDWYTDYSKWVGRQGYQTRGPSQLHSATIINSGSSSKTSNWFGWCWEWKYVWWHSCRWCPRRRWRQFPVSLWRRKRKAFFYFISEGAFLNIKLDIFDLNKAEKKWRKSSNRLANFIPLASFYNPWKHQKNL